MESKMVVCNIYELLRQGKKFVKEGRLTERTDAVVTRDWANRHNDDWENLGLWFEIDEEKTKEYYRKGKVKRGKVADAIKKKKQLTAVVSDILESANEKIEDIESIEVDDVEEIEIEKENEEVEVEKEDVIDINSLRLGDLKVEYLEKFGKQVPVNKKNNKEWIYNKINE